MARYRVGVGGLLVTDGDGKVTVLEAGTVLCAIPAAYDGTLEVIELDELASQPKRIDQYADKRMRYQDK